MKKMCVLPGNCHLSEAGQPTRLRGFNGEDIFTGDLVCVMSKDDFALLEDAAQGDDEEAEEARLAVDSLKNGQSTRDLEVVVKDDFKTYAPGSKIVRTSRDSGWVFGRKSADMNSRHIFKIKDHSEIEDGFSYQNFRYKLKELEFSEE